MCAQKNTHGQGATIHLLQRQALGHARNAAARLGCRSPQSFEEVDARCWCWPVLWGYAVRWRTQITSLSTVCSAELPVCLNH